MLGTETVRILSPSKLDDDNNPVAVTGTDVADCLVENATVREDQGRPDELRGQAAASISTVRVYMPITSGVTTATALLIRGKRYNVIGDPEAYINDEDPDLSGYVVLARSGRG